MRWRDKMIPVSKKDFPKALQRQVQRYIGMNAYVSGLITTDYGFRVNLGYIQKKYYPKINTLKFVSHPDKYHTRLVNDKGRWKLSLRVSKNRSRRISNNETKGSDKT